MSASLFGGGAAVTANVNGSFILQTFTATASQTLFILTQFTYAVGSGSLLVFINGQKQRLTADYVETSSSRITFVEALVAGDIVEVIGLPAAVVSTVPTGATGTATFSAATSVAVVFATPQANTNYKIALGAGANKTFWWTNKTVNGFTLNASAVSSDSVDWIIGQ